MSDLDELLNSLSEPPSKDTDELDDVLNALNNMVSKKQEQKTQAKEDHDELADLINDLDKPAQPAADNDLDDLLDALNEPPKKQTPQPAQPAAQPKPAPAPAAQPKPQPAERDELADLLDELDAPAQPAAKPQPAPAAQPKPAERDELEDLLDELDKPAPKPASQPKQPAAQPKPAERDELADLLNDLDTPAQPAKPQDTNVPMQAVFNDDPNRCAECGRPITAQRMTALNKSYHPECFVCRSCKTPLGTNPFHNVENQPYCHDCFVAKFAKVCARCKKPITSDMVNALNKSWHRECFTCTGCNTPFATPSFYQKDGNPYCEACYKAACAPKCAGCAKPIVGSSLMALGKSFHPECFVCNVCKCPFPNGQFYNMDGVPVCQEHYRKNAAPAVCAKCGNNIAAGTEFVSAMGQKWHPEHFVCSFCVNPLTQDSFKQNGGKPYCFSCYEKLFG